MLGNRSGAAAVLFLMNSALAMKRASDGANTGGVMLIAYLAAYAGTLIAMHRIAGFGVAEALFVLTILGVGFSGAAWLWTIGVSPLLCPILSPQGELVVIVTYLVPVVVFITWGLEALHRYIAPGPANAFAVAAGKLLVFVLVPAGIMTALFKYEVPRLTPLSGRTPYVRAAVGMSALLISFQALFGRGLTDIRSAHLPASLMALGIPMVFAWLAVEAGVVEEFFFRVLLQSRLSAVLKSELAAIVVTSVIFGLAHAPGLYLRTDLTQEGLSPHPSLLMAVGYSIVITSVAGFFLGILWARTRNFAVVVFVHAAGDLLPNLLPTLRSLHLVS